MANIRVKERGTNYLRWEIYNLQYPADQYSGFKVVMGSREQTWTSSNPDYNTWSPYFTGLNPGTSYTAYGYSKWGSTWYSTGSATASTLSVQLSEPSLKSLYSTTNSITVSFYTVPNATSYYIACSNGDYYWRSTPSATFSGLADDTSYQVMCMAIASGYTDSDYTWYSIRTQALPKLATPNLSSISSTETTITVTYSTVSGADTYYVELSAGWAVPSRTAFFSGLQPDTTYGVRCWCSGYGYSPSDISSWYYMKTKKPAPPSAPTGLTQNNDSTTTSRIYFSWNSVQGATGYHIYKDNVYQKTVASTSTYLDFSGSAQIGVIAYSDAGQSPGTVVTMWSRPPTPTYNSHNISTSSVYLKWNAPTSAEYYWCYYKKASSSTWISVGTKVYNTYYTFTGLDQDTSYNFRVKALRDTSGGTLGSDGLERTYRTLIGYQRPSNWTWTSSELNAFNNRGPVSTLTYLRWNSFLDRVDEFISYYNTRYGTSVPSVSGYKMTSSNKTLTSARFNGVKFSIGSMNSTGITDRYPGQTVMGWYFTRLSDSINEID